MNYDYNNVYLVLFLISLFLKIVFNKRKKDLKTDIFRKLNNLKIKQCYLYLLKQLAE